MLVGYARTSTAEQVAGLEAQVRDLEALGVQRVFAERVSSVTSREQLTAALDFVRDGDTLLCTKMDRLARSVSDLLGIVETLKRKGVALRVVAMGGGEPLDTETATGRLLLTMLGAVAEFERAMMLERQREGIAKAKAEGRYRGRAPTAQRQAGEAQRLRDEGVTPTEIAKRLGLSRMSVYRVLKGGPLTTIEGAASTLAGQDFHVAGAPRGPLGTVKVAAAALASRDVRLAGGPRGTIMLPTARTPSEGVK